LSYKNQRILGEENMSRRTITIEPNLDKISNFVRGFFLLIGQEYNYTQVVNVLFFMAFAIGK